MNSGTAKQDKRNAILQAASACFGKYGYAKTTLDDIGQAARLNKASLYYYFRNKEAMFMEVVLGEAEEFFSALSSKVAGLDSPEARIQCYLVERLRYYRQVLNLHQLSMEDLRTLEPVFNELYRGVWKRELDFLAGLIRQGAESGHVFTTDPEGIAEILLRTADAVKHDAFAAASIQALDAVDYSSIEQKISHLSTLVLRGIRAPG